MVVSCFVLDLASMLPSLLGDLKQCLLHLGNLYALQRERVPALQRNGIAVCCVDRAAASGCYELRIIQTGKGPFVLRDFHHAVSSLSCGAAERLVALSLPSMNQVSILSQLLKTEDCVNSWGNPGSKKIVMISCLFTESSSSFQQTLQEAADRCVPIEFVHIQAPATEQHPKDILQYKVADFALAVSDFDNCTWQSVGCDPRTLAGLVKRWFKDITVDSGGPLEVVMTFPEMTGSTLGPIFCTAYPAIIPLHDTIDPCQTCRCHETVIGTTAGASCTEKPVCPITGRKLGVHDVADNCLTIGSRTVLHMPSFKTPPSLSTALPSSLSFNVIQYVRLDTLSAGLLFGLPHVLVSSSEFDVDFASEEDVLEVNEQTLLALSQELHSADLGLICTSDIDVSSRTVTAFPCFYALLPSESGSLLAQRIAASEELLPGPQPGFRDSTVPGHVTDSVSSYFAKVKKHTYEPLSHERGCHSTLAGLLKESLQVRVWFRPIEFAMETSCSSNDQLGPPSKSSSFFPYSRPVTKRVSTAGTPSPITPRLVPNPFKAPTQIHKPGLSQGKDDSESDSEEDFLPDDFQFLSRTSYALGRSNCEAPQAKACGVANPVSLQGWGPSSRKRPPLPTKKGVISTTGSQTSPSSAEPQEWDNEATDHLLQTPAKPRVRKTKRSKVDS